MQTVTILRELSQRRVLVGAVAVLAVAVGFLLAFRIGVPPESRSSEIGVATARILVDTPRSQVVDVTPRGSETLGARAAVLANLMVEGQVKAAIARRAGLQPRQISASAVSQNESPGAKVESGAKDYKLTTSVLTNTDLIELPIIKVDTEAPSPAEAARLANSAVGGLGAYLDSKAATERVAVDQRLRVKTFGDAQGAEASSGPGPLVALAATIFVFLGGCAVILVGSALARAWRRAAASEHASVGDLASTPHETRLSRLTGDPLLELVPPERDPPERDPPERDPPEPEATEDPELWWTAPPDSDAEAPGSTDDGGDRTRRATRARTA